ncbi:hypothetical protein LFL96_15400 [Paraburkholderia sp. D15]|uniref:hypothetical protein n=1 Tax=Paraburkholderia sp. D15 TaxID=2880218 RepID=UPI0024786354|nr:hypothetical protein [Paraburkholderia sp. D15]WGS49137.1 hypothetical protein LFL96_15400 [Paraburkholderia sp. D15]
MSDIGGAGVCAPPIAMAVSRSAAGKTAALCTGGGGFIGGDGVEVQRVSLTLERGAIRMQYFVQGAAPVAIHGTQIRSEKIDRRQRVE